MPGNPEAYNYFEKFTLLLPDRFQYLPNWDEDAIKSIEKGIVFIMAFWSGPSSQAFHELIHAIQNVSSDDWDLVVVDIDGIPETYNPLELENKVAGCGEVAWIQNGKLLHIHTLGIGTDRNQYRVNTTEFLSKCFP